MPHRKYVSFGSKHIGDFRKVAAVCGAIVDFSTAD